MQGRGKTKEVVIIPDNRIDMITSKRVYDLLLKMPEYKKIPIAIGTHPYGDVQVIDGTINLTFYDGELMTTDNSTFDFKDVDALYFSATLSGKDIDSEVLHNLHLSQSTAVMSKIEMVKVLANIDVKDKPYEDVENVSFLQSEVGMTPYVSKLCYSDIVELNRDIKHIGDVMEYNRKEVYARNSIGPVQPYTRNMEFATKELERLLALRKTLTI